MGKEAVDSYLSSLADKYTMEAATNRLIQIRPLTQKDINTLSFGRHEYELLYRIKEYQVSGQPATKYELIRDLRLDAAVSPRTKDDVPEQAMYRFAKSKLKALGLIREILPKNGREEAVQVDLPKSPNFIRPRQLHLFDLTFYH